MKYMKLKNASFSIPEVSLGTWGMSGAKLWGENEEAQSIRTIHAALEHGINLIDSAEKYGEGKAEEVLGKALAGHRSQIILATKASNGLQYDQVIQSCENSLRRLHTDYIDLYQIHWPDHAIPVEETFRAFEKLKQDGKIRAVSVCNHGPQDLDKIAPYAVALNQVPYSLVWRVAEKEILPASESHRIAAWTYSPLGQGLLTGKFHTIEDVPLSRRANRMYSSAWGQGRHTDSGFEVQIFELIGKLETLCLEAGCSMTALALAFNQKCPGFASILLGARNVEQLEQNVQAYETKIPAEVVERARALSEPLKQAEGDNADLWENLNGGRIR